MDLDPWVSDLPTLQVPDELLKKSIERALVDIAKRHQTDLKIFNESKLWFNSNNLFFFSSLPWL